MATKELTPRQQEIRKLMDQGKTPAEVAKKLKITDNAVYQQLRRIRETLGTPKASGSKPKASSSKGTTARRQSTRKPAAPAAPRPAAEQRTMTPLQAVHARRDEINSTLKDARDEQAAAVKALESANETLAKAEGRFADELAQLDAAEAALRGEKPAAKRNGSGSRKAGAKAAANGAQAAPPAAEATATAEPEPEPAPAAVAEPQALAEDVDEPHEDEAALVGAETDPAEFERPGVPVDPDFDQSGAEGEFGE